MGHGYRGYKNSDGGRGRASGIFSRLPTGLKVILGIVVLAILFVVLSVAGLIVLVLIKAVSGGSLPGFLQGILDFFQQNIQPILDTWNQLQGVLGG